MIEPAGPLLAAGRSADIYIHTEGRVLRRRRSGPIGSNEVVSMRLARAAGYPAPEVHAVDGADMVLERVDGVDLLTDLTRRPWRAWRHGRAVGDLVATLAAIDLRDAGPDAAGLPVRGEPESLVHGDLHPGNVVLTGRGPVVIDWEGAWAGPRDADAATTWLLMSAARPDDLPLHLRPIVGLIQSVVRRAFLRRAGRARPGTVDLVCEIRLGDPNMRPVERERIRAFRQAHGTGGVGRDRP